LSELKHSTFRWGRKIRTTKSAEIKRNSAKVLKSILHDLSLNFHDEARVLRKFLGGGITEQSRGVLSRDIGDEEVEEMRSSADFPSEYRKKD
jgi:hypothetical protein